MPGRGLGDPAADDRPERRRQHRHDAGDGGGERLAAARKQEEDGGEDERDENAAGKALNDARRDQRGEIEAERAGDGGEREDAERGDEGRAVRPSVRMKRPVKRNGDDLGDEIGGLDPAHPVGADGERLLDDGKRRHHDLDVEDRHEHAEAHGGEAGPGTGGGRKRIG